MRFSCIFDFFMDGAAAKSCLGATPAAPKAKRLVPFVRTPEQLAELSKRFEAAEKEDEGGGCVIL